ncbi:hypothetical protein ONZ51_g1935 [Trametes cubensis]|uniref:ATPase of the ABC class C-terminal domain-containing protein n=1 Tax=Trametes cubensis TaxID=1111947 RepID=A0AAD7U0I6_9APHY|nr:hypothetical protein ONZ51_g1935 [Trametes cubensis]
MHIQSEDGRAVTNADVFPSVITNLPGNGTTTSFSTQDANGSTSMAAGIIEGIEVGADVLLSLTRTPVRPAPSSEIGGWSDSCLQAQLPLVYKVCVSSIESALLLRGQPYADGGIDLHLGVAISSALQYAVWGTLAVGDYCDIAGPVLEMIATCA